MSSKNSIRKGIMDILKAKFGGLALWDSIEKDLAVICSNIPEMTNEECKWEIVLGLNKIREYLLEKGINEIELEFIGKEIENFENTKQISLYIQDDDFLDKDTIDKYARLGSDTEGMVGIHLPLNYKQLGILTNGVFSKTKLIKFYISREKVIYGKIVAEMYEYAQKIPVATLAVSKKMDKETEDPMDTRIFLFGEKFPGKDYIKKKEIEFEFFVYRFISSRNEEMILLTTSPHEIGDYIVTGVVTQWDDYRAISDSAKLPTKLPFFFAQDVKDKIVKYRNHKEFKSRLEYLKIEKDIFFEYPFTIKHRNKTYNLLQPVWFKWMIWAWLLHEKKGMLNTYPLHILMIGPPSSGKSILLNSMHDRTKEGRKIFSGSSSTLKSLVPSFKEKPAKLGYLAESNRFGFCDEFLRCLVNTKTTREGSDREEGVAIMNDLLEHQKREAGSGISKVNVNMTARVLAATNPIKGIKTMEDLLGRFDLSWLSRLLVYIQSDDHVKLIRSCKNKKLPLYNFSIDNDDWISIIDYMHSFSSKYDLDRVDEIYNSVTKLMSEDVKKNYDTRYHHHIECVMDGIIKARCLCELDMKFSAKEIDYKVLGDVWKNLIKSWIQPEHIKNAPVEDRIFYLPENCQYIYWEINKHMKSMTRDEIKEIAKKEMSPQTFWESLGILIDNGVLLEDGNTLRPHYMKDGRDAEQTRLSDREENERVDEGNKASE